MAMTETLIATPSLCRICLWRRNETALRIDSSIRTSNYDPAIMAPARSSPLTLPTCSATSSRNLFCGEVEFGSWKTAPLQYIRAIDDWGCAVLLHAIRTIERLISLKSADRQEAYHVFCLPQIGRAHV